MSKTIQQAALPLFAWAVRVTGHEGWQPSLLTDGDTAILYPTLKEAAAQAAMLKRRGFGAVRPEAVRVKIQEVATRRPKAGKATV